MSEARLIVVQGGLAVGKTTLARRLAGDLEYGLLAKDDIKELLFDRLGAPRDREDSDVYGRATMTALYGILETMARAGKKVIVESAFKKEFADKDFAGIAIRTGARILQLYCTADDAVKEERYKARILSGERHQGHGDSVHDTFDFGAHAITYGRLTIPSTIEVDLTETMTDARYNALRMTIEKEMQ